MNVLIVIGKININSMLLLIVILFIILIVLMIVQTALFIFDGILAKKKNKEVELMQQQLVTFQEQVKNTQAQYFSDLKNLRELNNQLSTKLIEKSKDLEHRDSIIHHQDILIKAYKIKSLKLESESKIQLKED